MGAVARHCSRRPAGAIRARHGVPRAIPRAGVACARAARLHAPCACDTQRERSLGGLVRSSASLSDLTGQEHSCANALGEMASIANVVCARARPMAQAMACACGHGTMTGTPTPVASARSAPLCSDAPQFCLPAATHSTALPAHLVRMLVRLPAGCCQLFGALSQSPWC